MIQLNWYQIFGQSIPDGRTVTPTDDIQIWLHCGNIWDKNYTTLAQVLADTDTLVALMASDNAVDYLVRSTTWIGNLALVPIMTSDNTPEGECFGSTYYQSQYDYYKVFDGDGTTRWASAEGDTTGSYVGYHFTSSVCVNKVTIKTTSAATGIIQGSSDGVTYEDIQSINITTAETDMTFSFSNGNKYPYYRFYNTTAGYVSPYTIQFGFSGICQSEIAMKSIGASDYASTTLLSDSTWCDAINGSTYSSYVENASVPTMTSYNTPSGVCSASSIYTGYYPYYAFDGNSGSLWHGTAIPAWVMYEFETPMMAVKCLFNPQYNNSNQYVKDYKIQGSNDNVTWDDLYSETLPNADVNKTFSLSNTTTYKYYRMYATSSYSGNAAVKTLQFYGRQNGGVQTWLRTAGITNKNYTTLSEVLADTSTLSTLINNHSACDYLVTCTGWATTICADSNAMTYIGQNNYCANKLLADATWCKAIVASAYAESVMNIKVPVMTSATTPEGVVFSNPAGGTGYEAYRAFDNRDITKWEITHNSSCYIGYRFTKDVKILGVVLWCDQSNATAKQRMPKQFKVQYSPDGMTWNDMSTYTTEQKWANPYGIGNVNEIGIAWRIVVISNWGNTYLDITGLQFYGREDV